MRQSTIEVFFLAAIEGGVRNSLDKERLDPLLLSLSRICLDEFSVDCLTDAYGMLDARMCRRQTMRADVEREWKRLADRIGDVVTKKNTPRGAR